MQDVTISPVLNGWKCRVGCQEVVFTDKQTLLKELGDYMTDGEAVEKRFLERAVNRPRIPMSALGTMEAQNSVDMEPQTRALPGDRR